MRHRKCAGRTRGHPSHFTRAFRASTGMSPSEYRAAEG
ncbi:helix-turn-helix transcriptional regulator [Streptomyces sp. NPDC006739]